MSISSKIFLQLTLALLLLESFVKAHKEKRISLLEVVEENEMDGKIVNALTGVEWTPQLVENPMSQTYRFDFVRPIYISSLALHLKSHCFALEKVSIAFAPRENGPWTEYIDRKCDVEHSNVLLKIHVSYVARYARVKLVKKSGALPKRRNPVVQRIAFFTNFSERRVHSKFVVLENLKFSSIEHQITYEFIEQTKLRRMVYETHQTHLQSRIYFSYKNKWLRFLSVSVGPNLHQIVFPRDLPLGKFKIIFSYPHHEKSIKDEELFTFQFFDEAPLQLISSQQKWDITANKTIRFAQPQDLRRIKILSRNNRLLKERNELENQVKVSIWLKKTDSSTRTQKLHFYPLNGEIEIFTTAQILQIFPGHENSHCSVEFYTDATPICQFNISHSLYNVLEKDFYGKNEEVRVSCGLNAQDWDKRLFTCVKYNRVGRLRRMYSNMNTIVDVNRICN